jgi:deoxyribodipyrimidine photo-lyase
MSSPPHSRSPSSSQASPASTWTARAPTILWFRQDLRLADNPALLHACARGPVIPLYVWSPEEEGRWAPGAASRVWLHDSLLRLDEALREQGSRLVVRAGPAGAAIEAVAAESGAAAVVWNRRYEPEALARDRACETLLRGRGLEVVTANAALLHEPWEVHTTAGGPFQVFTPFWRACLARPMAAPMLMPRAAPTRLPMPARWPRSDTVEALGLRPDHDWANGLRSAFTPGEAGAHAALASFMDMESAPAPAQKPAASAGSRPVDRYASDRDRPYMRGTSRLSPHLHFGEIGPRQIWATVSPALAAPGVLADGAEAFLRELGWREFAYHLLFHFPLTPDEPLRSGFGRFPWGPSREALRAWQRGETGYPIVDAGLRELWATGWMHNRVRMIAASFLVKDLLQPWQVGARWFWDTLVDADLASNTLGWQWVAGCGADAAPYFRIFNPVTQAGRFDPTGAYVRRWLPELARLEAPGVHAPWKLAPSVLRGAGVELGRTYPRPIVDHAWARARALAAFAQVRR